MAIGTLLTDEAFLGASARPSGGLLSDDEFLAPAATELDTGATVTSARSPAAPRDVSWGDVVSGVADTMGPMMRRQVAGLMQYGANGEMTAGERADVMGSRYFGGAKGETEQETQAAINARRAEVRQSSARMAEEAARDMAAARPDVDPNSVKGFAYDFAVSMANMAPAVAATIATRQPGVGMSMIGGQVFGDQYAESREKGRSHDQAIQDGVFMAAAEAIPEAIPLGILARPGVSMISRFFKGTVAEGVQEVFTQALQDGYSAGVLDEEMTWGQAMENMARAGLLGSAMGGSFSLATEPFVRGRRGQDAQDGTAAPTEAVPVTPQGEGGPVPAGAVPGEQFIGEVEPEVEDAGAEPITAGSRVRISDPGGPLDGQDATVTNPGTPDSPGVEVEVGGETRTIGKNLLEPAQPKRMAPVTPDDQASPIATDKISRGKAMLDDAVAGRPLDIERPVEGTSAAPEGGRPEPEALTRAAEPLSSVRQEPDAIGSTDAVATAPGPEWRPLYSDTTRSEQVGWVNPQTGEERAFDAAPAQAEAPAETAPVAPAPPAARQQQDVPVIAELLTDQEFGVDGQQASEVAAVRPARSGSALSNAEQPKSGADQDVADAELSPNLSQRRAPTAETDSSLDIPPNRPDARTVNSTPLEGMEDSRVRDAQLGRDNSEVMPIAREGDSGIDIPSYPAVLEVVSTRIQDDEVFRAVVAAIPIDVMNDLAGSQLAAKRLRSDKAMFVDALARNADLPVGRRAMDIVVRASTTPITEVPSISSAGTTNNRSAATAANQADRQERSPISGRSLYDTAAVSANGESLQAEPTQGEGAPTTGREAPPARFRQEVAADQTTETEPQERRTENVSGTLFSRGPGGETRGDERTSFSKNGTTYTWDPELLEQADDLVRYLRRQVRQMNPNAKVLVVDKVIQDSTGRTGLGVSTEDIPEIGRAIVVAMRYVDENGKVRPNPSPGDTLNHEVMHDLRRQGLFTAEEESVLFGNSDRNRLWQRRFEVDRLYDGEPDAVRREEAAAMAWEAWKAGRLRVAGRIRRAFQKVDRFLRALANWVSGKGFTAKEPPYLDREAEQVFERIDAGEVGRREPRSEAGDTGTRFSFPTLSDRTAAEKKAARRLSAQDRALIDRHLAPAGGGLISRLAKASFIRDIARDGLADTLVTNIVTSLNPIFAYEKRAEAMTGGIAKVRDASVSAAKMAEFTMNDTGRTWAMFHVGPMRYDADQGIVVADETVPGLYDVFKYLSDPETYDRFRLYAAARRAERLAAEGRENNMTDAAIARGLDLADETGRHKGETRTFRQVFDDYQRFNKALLEGMGRDTGMMSQEDIDFYTEHMDYVPFYREAEDTGTVPTGAYLRKNINKPDAGIKTLKGGEQRIADLMENIVRNAEAITRAGMRNVTMRRIYEIAEVLGEGQIVRDGSTEDGVLTYRVNGREVKFTVDDPSLVAAVASMRPEQHTGLYKALVSITGFFRAGITAMPGFMIRNLMRGTEAGFVQTGKNISLQHNVATGLKRAWRNDRSIRELKAITGTGSYTFGGPSGNAAGLLRRSTGAQRDFLPISVVKSVWGALERAGEATELADRDAIYNNLIREGATKAEAAYQAMNLINYSRKGSSRSLRVLLPLVPFLNARIQGLYRMGETQTGGVDRRKILTGVAMRGLVLTAVSVALREATKDDDRYDDEPLHRKLNYYIFYVGDSRILIPKAFEFGALFSTLPELTLDAIEQKEGARLAEGLAQTMLTTFAFNPIPQPALPIIENIANYNFFTGREIENQRLQNLPAGQRYTAATPQVLREIGKATDLSPAQMENLIRGYTGSMGMSMLAGLDSMGRAAGIFPSEPTGPFGDFGMFSDALQDQIGSMYRKGPDRSNRWVGDLYELSRDINQTYRQVQSLAEEGEMEAARKAAEDGRIEWRTFVNRQVKALSNINAQIRMVEEDPGLSGAYKRTELNRLYQIRNRIAEMAVKKARGR